MPPLAVAAAALLVEKGEALGAAEVLPSRAKAADWLTEVLVVIFVAADELLFDEMVEAAAVVEGVVVELVVTAASVVELVVEVVGFEVLVVVGGACVVVGGA